MRKNRYPKMVSITPVALALSLIGCQTIIPTVTSSNPPLVSIPPTTTIVLAHGTIVPGPAILASIEQAQSLVSFSLLTPDPRKLPSGLRLERVEWWPRNEKGVESISMSYVGDKISLSISETKAPSWSGEPQGVPYQEITIRGHTGYLFTMDSINAHAVAWQENNVYVLLNGQNMSLDELLQIAESMKPPK